MDADISVWWTVSARAFIASPYEVIIGIKEN